MTLVQKEVKRIMMRPGGVETQIRPPVVISDRPDINTAVSDNKSLTVTKTKSAIQGICFSKDGTQLYYSDYDNDSTSHIIRQYTLSTPRDITTGTSTTSVGITGKISGIYISDDGTSFFVSGENMGVKKYPLSTAYNISTLGSSSESINLGSLNLTGLSIGDGGTKIYYMNYSNSRCNEYSTSTAWSLSSATSVGYIGYPVSGNVYRDCAISIGGGKIYMVRQMANSIIYQMDMSTPFNITTATYNSLNKTVPFNACGIYVKPDGTKMYLSDINNAKIYQYSLG